MQKRENKIRPLTLALIKNKNKIFVIKGVDRKMGKIFYRLPGGGIEFG